MYILSHNMSGVADSYRNLNRNMVGLLYVVEWISSACECKSRNWLFSTHDGRFIPVFVSHLFIVSFFLLFFLSFVSFFLTSRSFPSFRSSDNNLAVILYIVYFAIFILNCPRHETLPTFFHTSCLPLVILSSIFPIGNVRTFFDCFVLEVFLVSLSFR